MELDRTHTGFCILCSLPIGSAVSHLFLHSRRNCLLWAAYWSRSWGYGERSVSWPQEAHRPGEESSPCINNSRLTSYFACGNKPQGSVRKGMLTATWGMRLGRLSWVLRNHPRRGDRQAREPLFRWMPIMDVLGIMLTPLHTSLYLILTRLCGRYCHDRSPFHRWKPGGFRRLGELPKAAHMVRGGPEVKLLLEPVSSQLPLTPPLLWFFPSLSWKAGVRLSLSLTKHKGKDIFD